MDEDSRNKSGTSVGVIMVVVDNCCTDEHLLSFFTSSSTAALVLCAAFCKGHNSTCDAAALVLCAACKTHAFHMWYSTSAMCWMQSTSIPHVLSISWPQRHFKKHKENRRKQQEKKGTHNRVSEFLETKVSTFTVLLGTLVCAAQATALESLKCRKGRLPRTHLLNITGGAAAAAAVCVVLKESLEQHQQGNWEKDAPCLLIRIVLAMAMGLISWARACHSSLIWRKGREGKEGLILLFKASANIEQHCDHEEEEEEADKKRTFSRTSPSIFSKPRERERERGDRAFQLREIFTKSLNSLLPLHCCRFLDPNCRRFRLSRSIHYYTILFVLSFLLSFLVWTVASVIFGVVGVFLFFFVLACQRSSVISKGFRRRSTMRLRKLSSLFDSKQSSRVFFILLVFLSRLLFRFCCCCCCVFCWVLRSTSLLVHLQ